MRTFFFLSGIIEIILAMTNSFRGHYDSATYYLVLGIWLLEVGRRQV